VNNPNLVCQHKMIESSSAAVDSHSSSETSINPMSSQHHAYSLIATGFTMGVLHVVAGPDHLSALATLAVGSSWKALTLGVSSLSLTLTKNMTSDLCAYRFDGVSDIRLDL
jgi:hydrogenase/urease accessory protein HupE